jgi:tRNA pseudouridine38-40 synthase
MTTAFKLIVEYDGTDYSGWQIQNDVPTIQGEIEKVLQRITGQSIRVSGSGRTDAGVHALGQVAGFVCKTKLSVTQLHKGLNSLLPSDIVIHSLEPVPAAFHPRYDVTSKIYRYRILNRKWPDAILRRYAWHLRRRLDIDAMDVAARHLLGRHDFKAFEGVGSPRSSTVRHILSASITRQESDLMVFEVKADGFLRFMVRNIVGTLVEVGLSKISPDDFLRVLASRDRSQAGPTAPPHGLFLIRVFYEKSQMPT